MKVLGDKTLPRINKFVQEHDLTEPEIKRLRKRNS